MLKKVYQIVFMLCLIWLAPLGVSANDDLVKMAQDAGYPATAEIAPKGAIVIDADTGQVIWGHDMDLQRDPASTTKTMVIYLTMEAIKAGKISMDTEVVATPTDQAISGIFELSNNKITAGVTYTVRELLTMTFVPSSNVTTLMLAHLIFQGTDAQFIELMNKTAQDLGMTNTVFYNGTGANIGAFKGYYAPEGYDPDRYNLTTVKDLSILARALITKHPEVLDFTDDKTVTVKKGTPQEETFHTYNHSLPGDKLAYEGVDGLKTGSSPTADYNSIVTAKRGNTRLIVVVLGASKWGDSQGEYVRHYFVNGLLDYAFKHYEKKEILSAGQQTIDGKTYELAQPLTAMVKKGDSLPTVTVTDDQATLDKVTGVSGVISVSAKPVQNSIANFIQPPAKTDKKAQEFNHLLTLIIILLVLLIILISILLVLEIAKQRRRKR